MKREFEFQAAPKKINLNELKHHFLSQLLTNTDFLNDSVSLQTCQKLAFEGLTREQEDRIQFYLIDYLDYIIYKLSQLDCLIVVFQ